MEEEKRKDKLQAVWFAAGMAVMIAWRVWVFLTLNLLLIAILFTSTHPSKSSSHSNPPPKTHQQISIDHNTNSERSRKIHDDHGGGDRSKLVKFRDERENMGEVEDGKSTMLSKEELNERVEAFIATFRQQYLVSDVNPSRITRFHSTAGGAAILSKNISV